MEYFKLISKETSKNSIKLTIESYDTAILELIIDRLNRNENVAATYTEIHPLTHQYELTIIGLDEKEIKNILKNIQKELDFKL